MSGKEQAKEYNHVSTSLYTVKPHVWSKVNISKSQCNGMYERNEVKACYDGNEK